MSSRETASHGPPLLGRDAELATARGFIDGGERLATTVGPPGIGKTSLARRLIHPPREPADPTAGAIVALSADDRRVRSSRSRAPANPKALRAATDRRSCPASRACASRRDVSTRRNSRGQLLAIDVATGDRVVVSSHGSSAPVGEGGELGFSRLAIDADSERVVTIDDGSGGFTLLTDVALGSGDRTVISLVSNTAHGPGDGGVWIHPTRPLLVSVAWSVGITLVDPATGEANLFSN